VALHQRMVKCLSIFVGDTMLVMLMNFEHQTFISNHSNDKAAGQLASRIQGDFASVNFV